MVKTFLLSHVSDVPNVGRVLCLSHVENFGSEKRKYRNIRLFFGVCLVCLPCLVKPFDASAKVLPERNSRLLVSPELLRQNVAMTSGFRVQSRDGRKEGRPESLGSGVESVSGFVLASQNAAKQSCEKYPNECPHDGFGHDFPFYFIMCLHCGALMFFVIFHH